MTIYPWLVTLDPGAGFEVDQLYFGEEGRLNFRLAICGVLGSFGLVLLI
jgi:hypothetical protein